MKAVLYLFMSMVLLHNVSVAAVDTLYDNRFKQWQAKAKTGDSFSQYSLGNAYLRGNEVAIDRAKAVHWFTEAAKQGHAKSQYKLGYLYYSGKGVKRNYRTALDWFKLAANNEYSPAQFYLGKMYASGQGTKKNYDKATSWLNKALENDYSPAARELERVKSVRSNAVKTEDSPTQARKTNKRADTVKKASNKTLVAIKTQPTTVKPVKTVKKKKKTKKKKKFKSKLSVAQLLLQGSWTMDGEPTELLPSDLNECSANASELYCKTSERHITTDYADVNYKIESIAGRFNNEKNSFTLKNKKNTLFVMPSDPDDPDVDPDNIPATGIETQVMKCKFESNDKIRCFNDDFQKVYFTRK